MTGSGRAEISVRLAHAGDAPAIAGFDEWNSATPDRLAAGHCFVATLGGEICGLGVFDRSFFRRPFVAIIYVHPDRRRQGIGSALLAHFEHLSGPELMWISTNAENVPMQRLLHRRGYDAQGVVHGLGRVPEVMYRLRPSAGP
ncbi:MAG: GNAT family N-acetyltransferase [Phycisphaerales bacterium]|nr:GNAT family N-acetyltransferase [Phycisphaerae bacterium]NNF44595.1 GNAT family N-acetyltransferase [Phycisphaerales bacterium]NNM26766.1 GNAT family N-acetyltransferase [Phycisphaerales bacterium]